MSEIPVSLTFDNMAAIAIKELKAPLVSKLDEANRLMDSIEEEIIDLQENKHPQELLSAVNKKHKPFITSLKKVGNIKVYDNVLNNINISLTPDTKAAEGEIIYYLSITKKEYDALKTVKRIKYLDEKLTSLAVEICKLEGHIRKIDEAKDKVKTQLMEAIIASNVGHTEFKELVKKKISSIV